MTILGDWGTTRLRLFRVEDGAIVDRLDGPGIGQLAGSPAETLAATLAPWREAARASGVMLCGMAGSRNGLVEVPYAICPADIALWRESLSTVDVDGIAISVAPGLSTANFSGHADVMRGEETQIFGAAALDPALGQGRAMLVLPGTHSKWAVVRDGAVTGFRTLMTGELYALLQRHSILGGDATATRDDAAFARGVATARDSGAAGALGRLFTARALMLDGVLAPGAVPDYLSGLLIGEEFRIALADGLARRDMPLQLIGDPALCERYRRAAALFDIDLPSPLQDAAAHGLWRLAVQAGVAVTAPEETRAC